MKSSYDELLRRLQSKAREDGVPLETIEQDYAISYIARAVALTPELNSALVFKGGAQRSRRQQRGRYQLTVKRVMTMRRATTL